jgi:hypothetical protein
MVMDRNPKFGADTQFAEGARRVADLLWENTGGDVSAFPRSYLENLRHDYADGRISMMELIDRVDLPEDATYDDYVEVIDALLYTDPSQWPDPDTINGTGPGGRITRDDVLDHIDRLATSTPAQAAPAPGAGAGGWRRSEAPHAAGGGGGAERARAGGVSLP